MPEKFEVDWKAAKKAFKNKTGVSKPKTKIFGVAIKTSGIENSFKLLSAAPNYAAKVAALKIVFKATGSYMATLKKEADACSGKEDDTYEKAVRALATELASAGRTAKNHVTEFLFRQMLLIKSGKLDQFRQHCEKEFSTENIDFYFALKGVKTRGNLLDIGEEYVIPSAPRQVNISAKAKKAYAGAFLGENSVADAVQLLQNDTMANLADSYSRFTPRASSPNPWRLN